MIRKVNPDVKNKTVLTSVFVFSIYSQREFYFLNKNNSFFLFVSKNNFFLDSFFLIKSIN